MDSELHRADPRVRRDAAWLVVAITVCAGVAIWALRAWLGGRGGAAAETDSLLLVAVGLVGLLTATSLGLAWALWQEAARIQREDRFPPSDMRTLRDVAVRHGDAAGRYARLMRAGAVTAAAAAAGILFWGWRLVALAA